MNASMGDTHNLGGHIYFSQLVLMVVISLETRSGFEGMGKSVDLTHCGYPTKASSCASVMMLASMSQSEENMLKT